MNEQQIYTVIHLTKDGNLRSSGKVYDTFVAADAALRQLVKDFKVKGWLMAFDDPRPMETLRELQEAAKPVEASNGPIIL